MFFYSVELMHRLISIRFDSLYTRYKKELKRITVTGGGLGGNDQDPVQTESQEDSVSYYIGADGPDDTTPIESRNIWRACLCFIGNSIKLTVILAEKINEGFPFFAEMHRYLCGRPNAIPPLVTTGVGPAGRSVVQFQPIEEPAAATEPQLEMELPVLATPIHPPATTKKRPAKESSFAVTDAAVEKAKSSIQRVQKKSLEERLADATEFVSFFVIHVRY